MQTRDKGNLSVLSAHRFAILFASVLMGMFLLTSSVSWASTQDDPDFPFIPHNYNKEPFPSSVGSYTTRSFRKVRKKKKVTKKKSKKASKKSSKKASKKKSSKKSSKTTSRKTKGKKTTKSSKKQVKSQKSSKSAQKKTSSKSLAELLPIEPKLQKLWKKAQKYTAKYYKLKLAEDTKGSALFKFLKKKRIALSRAIYTYRKMFGKKPNKATDFRISYQLSKIYLSHVTFLKNVPTPDFRKSVLKIMEKRFKRRKVSAKTRKKIIEGYVPRLVASLKIRFKRRVRSKLFFMRRGALLFLKRCLRVSKKLNNIPKDKLKEIKKTIKTLKKQLGIKKRIAMK